MPPPCGGFFDVDGAKTRLTEIEATMSAADFWKDKNRARTLGQESASLRRTIEQMEDVNKRIADTEGYSALAGEGALQELEGEVASIGKILDALEFRTLFSGPYDSHNAIVDIHAGSGGTEANDWTGMLLRMYMRFAESKGWRVTMLSESPAEEAGYKSVTLRMEGEYAYGTLRSEAGVHRLVRISPFDAEKMRHTTFALVNVIPEFDEVPDIVIDPKDIRVDTFLSSGHGGQSVQTTYSAVRVVHIPTGVVVSCQNERSQQQNRETAMKILASRLYQIEQKKRERQVSDIRGDVQSAEWGNQIRSYVLHPYKLVKDHRTEAETQEAEDVLNGDLDIFVQAYLRSQVHLSH